MTQIRLGLRSALLFVLTLVVLALDIEAAHAQAAQCAQLQGALAQFDRNGDFRSMGNNNNNSRQLARQVQAAESQYIRQGCNDAAKAGRQLTPQCKAIGQQVLSLRDQYSQVSQSVDTANAVAQQREAILQEMARFGCNTGSSANFSSERQSIFDRIFGSTSEGDFTNGDFVDGGGYWGNQGYNTVRTLCVRLSDGYFWPISYATLPDYIGQDAQTCQASCPNTQVDLYFYDNPGQEPEQMRNMYGQSYTALPTAFAYRNAFDKSASCRAAPTADGSVTMASRDDGSSHGVVQINGVTIPMPIRDPRGAAPVQAAVAAETPVAATVALADVPLPRPRPSAPGEAPRPNAVTPQQPEDRVVTIGDRTVRVVGPDTPYAQLGQSRS